MSVELPATRSFPRVLLLVCASLGGCVGDIGDESAFTDASLCPADFQAAVLTPRCGLEGCHTPYEPSGGLDFVSPDLELRLVGKTAITCGDTLRIDPSTPENSFLLTRLAPNPTCAGEPVDRMPLTGDFLTDAELECARAFIAKLAGGGRAH